MLELAREASEEEWAILGRLAVAVFWLDAHGRILRRNASAARSLGDGLDELNGLLVTSDALTSRRLRKLVSSSAADRSSGAERSMLVHRSSARPPRLLRVSHLAGGVLCVVVDLERRPLIDAEELVALFGLTSAEARVAVEIGRGAVPKEIAARQQTSYATVRTHLHRVYEKTSARSQSELVALLLLLGVGP